MIGQSLIVFALMVVGGISCSLCLWSEKFLDFELGVPNITQHCLKKKKKPQFIVQSAENGGLPEDEGLKWGRHKIAPTTSKSPPSEADTPDQDHNTSPEWQSPDPKGRSGTLSRLRLWGGGMGLLFCES